MPALRFDELTRGELNEYAPTATVVLPVGSTEQHGHHLPVCTDVAIVSALAERAVEQARAEIPVVLAPTLPFGFAHHHLPFGATISISLPVYLAVLTDIGKSLANDGFRRVVIINGHGGNDGPIRELGDRLIFEHGLDLEVAATSYWACAADSLTELGLDLDPYPGHAGSFETSCLLAIRPDLVDLDQRPAREDHLQPLATSDLPGAVVRRAGMWQISDGRTDDASRASGEAGEQALAAISARLARFIVEFHRSTQAQR